jgi:hypothetical protein
MPSFSNATSAGAALRGGCATWYASIADGELNVPNSGPLGRVSYLIFELAEGDIRTFRARLALVLTAGVSAATLTLRRLDRSTPEELRDL